MDSAGVARIPAGKFGEGFEPSAVDMMTGPGTRWDKTRRFLKFGSRADPAEVLNAKENAVQARRFWAKQLLDLEGVVPEGMTVAQHKLQLKKLQKALAKMTDEELVLAYRGDASAAHRAFSRMWLPQGVPIDHRHANMLLGLVSKFADKSPTYAVFIEEMRLATKALVGRVDDRLHRVHALGLTAAGNAVANDYSARLAQRAMGGVITPHEAASVNELFSNNYEGAVEVAMETLNRLGIPMGQKTVKLIRAGLTNAQEVSMKLIKAGEDTKGQAVFLPKALIDEFDSELDRVIKTLEPYWQGDVGRSLQRAGAEVFTAWLNTWRASVVSGWGLPNPRYWTNNILGDFSQMWLGEGLWTASKLSFLNLPTNLPGGRRFDEYAALQSRYAKRHGAQDALPSGLLSFLNPALGRMFLGESGVFRLPDGTTRTFEQVRRWAGEDSILETFVHQELADQYSHHLEATLIAGGLGAAEAAQALKAWNRTITDHASFVQQRQRMALYAHLIQKGVPRKEAARRTLEALYDWKHGVAQNEIRTLVKAVPFTRFWYLLSKQLKGAMLEPLVRPTGEVAKKALTGRSKLGILQKNGLISQGFPDWFYDNEQIQSQYVHPQIIEEAILAKAHPPWMDGRLISGLKSLQPERRQRLNQMGYGDFSHEALVWPTATTLDGMEFYAGLLGGAISMVGAIGQQVSGEPSSISQTLEAEGWESVLSQFLRPIEFTGRSGLGSMGVDLEYTQQGNRRWLQPHEARAMAGILPGSPKKDPETGNYYTTPRDYLLWRMIPLTSTNLPYWLKNVDRPELGEGLVDYLLAVGQETLRLPQRVPYSGQKEMESRIRDMNKVFQQRKGRGSDAPRRERVETFQETGKLPD